MSSFAQIFADALGEDEPVNTIESPADREVSRRFEAAAFSVSVATAAREADPTWASALQVSFPCSPDQLRRAFRQRAFETHPDRPGGSAEAFRSARSALDAGLHALTSPATASAAAKYRTRAV